MTRDEKNRLAWARMAERLNTKTQEREAKRERRKHDQKRWRMRQAFKSQSRAHVEPPRWIGQPGSPYETAIQTVERETGTLRMEWEDVLKHPNNVRVNEIALEIVQRNNSYRTSTDTDTTEAAA